jgi:SET domain-containing protein
MHHTDHIYVKKVKGKGRGVFAKVDFAEGDVIEQVPVLLIPVKTLVGGRDNPVLKKYFYEWDSENVAVCLGFGSLYNHSYEPNAYYEHGSMVMIYRALRDIAKDEEIVINYNWLSDDTTPVGFDVV